MMTRFISILFFVFLGFSAAVHGTEFEEYEVYLGDFNGDGKKSDIYFHGKDELLLIHGDILVPIFLDGPESFAYYQGENGSAVPVEFTDAELTRFSKARLDVNYFLNDTNGDRQVDAIVNVGGGSVTFFGGSAGLPSVLVSSRPYFEGPRWAQIAEVSVPDSTFVEPSQVSHDSTVGALPGNGSTNGGHSGYTIRIQVPPGIKDVQPNLAFQYNSNGGNGALGLGWSITGQNAIQRCGQTLVHDGQFSQVEYSETKDRLCMNGQRLLVVGGTYGVTGAVYRTEIDNFSRITQYGGLNGSTTYFKEELKNGRIKYYGATGNSRHVPGGAPAVLTWAVSREEDRTTSKNSIVYTYQTFGTGEHLLVNIAYTGSGTTKGNRTVTFEYETRPDITSAYTFGGLTRQTRRISKLVTRVGATRVLEYEPTYKLSEASNRSLMTHLQLCGFENGSRICMPASEFEWLDAKQRYEVQQVGYTNSSGVFVPQLQNERWIQHVMPQGDSNGDGVSDWKTWRQDAEGRYIGSNADPVNTCNYNFAIVGHVCLQADFNRDGKTDSWRVNDGAAGSSHHRYIELSYGGGQFFRTHVDLGTSYGRRPVEFGDFNLDGFTDIVVRRDNQLRLYLHTGDHDAPYVRNGGQVIFTFSMNGFNDLQTVNFVGDMDGNGTPDMAVSSRDISARGGGAFHKVQSLLLTKVSDTGQVSFERSSPGLPDGILNSDFYLSYFIDVNGDDLPDWLSWEPDGGLVLNMNKGAGMFRGWQEVGGGVNFPRRVQLVYNASNSEYEPVVTPKYEQAFRQFDINADGRMEILMPGRRLVDACITVQSVLPGDGNRRIERELCGDDIYTQGYRSSNLSNELRYLSASADRGVYEYDAFQFEQDANGNYTVVKVNTGIVGSTQSSSTDAFGNGLNDFVFTFGCDVNGANCELEPGTGVMAGKVAGAYISKNMGSATSSESHYQPTDMMIAVENGMGFRDEWDYRPLTSRDSRFHSSAKPFYERGGYLATLSGEAQKAHQEFTTSMYVVAEHRRSNGIGGMATQQFRYKGAVFNNEGRGYLGFHNVILEDLTQDTETDTLFHQVFPLLGQPYQSRVWQIGDRTSDSSSISPFREEHREWQFWALGEHASPTVVDTLRDGWSVNNAKPYFVGISEERSVRKKLALDSRDFMYSKQVTTDYDQWGNAVTLTSRYEEADGAHVAQSTQATEFNAADMPSWWLDQVKTQTQTTNAISSRTGATIQSGTDTEESTTTTYSEYDTKARAPKRIRTQPSSGKWQQVDTVFNAHGLVEEVTVSAESESLSRKTTTRYTSDGYFPDEVINPLEHSVSFTTDAGFGIVTDTTDANNLTTTYQLDGFGRKIKSVAPSRSGQTLSPDAHIAYEWCTSVNCADAPHAVIRRISQQAGAPLAIEYIDALQRTIRSETESFDFTDIVASYVQYNSRGLTTFESIPHFVGEDSGFGVAYSNFDTLGRPQNKSTSQTDGQSLDVTYAHEQGDGFRTDITANTLTMSRTYNGLEQLTKTVDAMNGITEYAYDGRGNPIYIMDAIGSETFAKYNALNQKQWVDDPNMGRKSFTYSGYSELSQQTDANNDKISYIYDRLGRTTFRHENGTQVAEWIYDSAANGIGLLERSVSKQENYSRTYQYDALSRPKKITTNIDGENYTVKSQYDSQYGRMKGMVYPRGLTVAYEYTDTGFQYRMTNAANDYVYQEIKAMDAWSKWIDSHLANGNTRIQRGFEAETGQMLYSDLSNGAFTQQRLDYKYDTYGNLSQRDVDTLGLVPNTSEEHYFYDDLHRLELSTRTNAPDIDYTYDAVGNFTSKSDFATDYDYTGSKPNAVSSVTLTNGSTRSYGYDANGNRTHENGTRQLWYNAYNKPERIMRNGANIEFYYNPEVARYMQINRTTQEVTTYIDKLFEKKEKAGQTQYRYFLGEYAILTETEENNTSSFDIGFAHRDRLGSNTALVNADGALLETFSFDPFGKPREGNNGDKAEARLLSDYTTRGFTDHEHLDDVELIHMNGRAYDYNLGRFLSVDPVIQEPTNSQSMNPYSYIMNNPLAGTDPTGYTGEKSVDVDVSYTNDAGDKITETITVTGDGKGNINVSGGSAKGRAAVVGATAGIASNLGKSFNFTSGGNTSVGVGGGLSDAGSDRAALQGPLPATVDSPLPSTAFPSPEGDPGKAGSLLAKLLKITARAGVVLTAGLSSSEAGEPYEQDLVIASQVGFNAGFSQAQEHEGNKVAVIGEEQKRVIRVATELGGAQIAPVWPEEYRFEQPMTDLQKSISIAFNQGWLNGIMSANFDVVDIGRSKNYEGRNVSDFYRAERILLKVSQYPFYRRRRESDTLNYDYE